MKHGTNVRFIGCSKEQIAWGGCDDPNPHLFIGDLYFVERASVHSSHTKIELRGVKGKFNSTCFEEAKQHGNV